MKIQTKQLKQDFEFIKEESMKFETHQELDKFVIKLLEKDPNFLKNKKNEFIVNLLKSFDRAFWLRWYFP